MFFRKPQPGLHCRHKIVNIVAYDIVSVKEKPWSVTTASEAGESNDQPPIAVQCTLCGERRVLVQEWSELYVELRAECTDMRCFATENCGGILVPWHFT